VKLVKEVLKKVCSEVETFNAKVYTAAKRIAPMVGVEELLPRLASRQQHRSNAMATSNQKCYCGNLTIPLLDHLITELNTKFHNSKSKKTTDFMKTCHHLLLLLHLMI